MTHSSNRNSARRGFILPAMPFLLALSLAGCDAFSPTSIENPNLTDRQFLQTPDAARTWLRGVERTFMGTLNNLVVNGELVSDNYYNNYTTNSKVFDIPRLDRQDVDVRSLQQGIARLRETAEWGLTTVLEADSTATPLEEAELLFYRGMAALFAGEYFVGLPSEALGSAEGWEAHLREAIDDFTAARSLVSDPALRTGYTLAIARAAYRLGDHEMAGSAAAEVLAADPSFVRWAEFDGVTGPSNSMQGLLTGSTNNFQPLPRLDFLDPKFPNRGPQIQSALGFLKAEEAHLILAEAAISRNDLPGAKARLISLLDLVETRPVEAVDARIQLRGRRGGTVIYPNTETSRVAFSPGAPLHSGYVLTREGDPIDVPTLSGTSVDRMRIEAAATPEDLLYTLYLMRQEIFIAEGRRISDLGIRYPLSIVEGQTNPNVVADSPFMAEQIPSFIPLDGGMDEFEYDESAETVVIRHDMNRVIVENRGSPFVVPFHD